jgi:hypothetical protein
MNRRRQPADDHPPGSLLPVRDGASSPETPGDTVDKDDWKAFMRWLESAQDEELERRLLAVTALASTFREEGPRADARRILREINLEREARRSLRQ